MPQLGPAAIRAESHGPRRGPLGHLFSGASGDAMQDENDKRRRFYEGISFASDAQIREWASQVAATWAALEPIDPKQEAADTRTERSFGAARAIINDFCLRQDLGEQQSPEALRWLAEALARILDHKDPLHSLGLMPRANKRPPDPQQAIDAAWWVRCAEANGYSHREAVTLAAETYGRDIKTIERYIAQAGEWAEHLTIEPTASRRYFEARRRPLPNRDKK